MRAEKILLATVPWEIRGRIFSGIRWTLWLSVLAAPFSYGTSVILGRTSPEAIGTYGLLMVYLGIVTSFFYAGGDTVVIRFLPEVVVAKRLSFLLSYFSVICLALIPWLAVVTLWPGLLRYVFGDIGGQKFQLLIIYLCPIYLFYSLVMGALKALLEMRLSQTLLRLLTMGQFFVYAALSVLTPASLATHYTGLVWGIYLGLVIVATAIGVRHLVTFDASRMRLVPFRFFLPRGFWRYMLSSRQVAAVTFFIIHFDSVLIVNFGGLALLGKYVAIMAIASLVRVINNFVLESLLPALTNLLALREVTGASEVFSMYWRIVLCINAIVGCGLILLAAPLTSLLGSEYASMRPSVVLMVLLITLSSPGWVGGILLSSAGKQHHNIWIGLGQLALFTLLFLGLWPRWKLLGAVLAYGISLLIAHTLLLVVAARTTKIDCSATKDYPRFALIVVIAAGIALSGMPLGILPAIAFWLLAIAGFLVISRYRVAECVELASRLVAVR